MKKDKKLNEIRHDSAPPKISDLVREAQKALIKAKSIIAKRDLHSIRINDNTIVEVPKRITEDQAKVWYDKSRLKQVNRW